MNIKLLPALGLLLTSCVVLSAENPESSGIRLSEYNGTVQAEITVGGYAPEGIKFVWSLNPDPVYPPRGGDRAEFRSLENLLEFTPEPFAGPGKYWIRAGWYENGGIRFYSDPIRIHLDGTGGVVRGEGMSIQVTVDEQVARVGVTITDSKPGGVKIVWSRTPNPEYPPRQQDQAVFRGINDPLETWLEAFDGPGTYYVRAGWYKNGRILFYSTQVETVLH